MSSLFRVRWKYQGQNYKIRPETFCFKWLSWLFFYESWKGVNTTIWCTLRATYLLHQHNLWLFSAWNSVLRSSCTEAWRLVIDWELYHHLKLTIDKQASPENPLVEGLGKKPVKMDNWWTEIGVPVMTFCIPTKVNQLILIVQ